MGEEEKGGEEEEVADLMKGSSLPGGNVGENREQPLAVLEKDETQGGTTTTLAVKSCEERTSVAEPAEQDARRMEEVAGDHARIPVEVLQKKEEKDEQWRREQEIAEE